jgi:hypothetical protein
MVFIITPVAVKVKIQDAGVPSNTKTLIYFEKRRKTKNELQAFDPSGQVS